MRLVKTKNIVDPDYRINFFYNIIGSWFYTGYFPKGSGTVGSLAAFIIFLIPVFNSIVYLSIAFIVIFILGTMAATPMMKRFGNDPSVLVADEVVGQWLTIIIMMAAGYWALDWLHMLIAFIAFRGFDILKIQPAKYFDKQHTALGAMLDDVMASLYAGIGAVVFFIAMQKFF